MSTRKEPPTKRAKCDHGRIRSQCKECGGGSICQHGRHRSKCKECGGGSICQHGRERTKCKECGGGSICDHGRRRSGCKECATTEPRKKTRIRKKANIDIWGEQVLYDNEEEEEQTEELGATIQDELGDGGEEDAGEMACVGGCKGEWNRYSFEELDWNQDPFAEDAAQELHEVHTHRSRRARGCSKDEPDELDQSDE